jgi:hypothetical protein
VSKQPMVWKQSPHLSCAIICEGQYSGHHADSENVEAYGGYLVAESVPPEAMPLILRAPQLEVANRELVEALEVCNQAFGKHCPDGGSTYGWAWAAVQAVLAKHKGAA